MEEKTIKIYFDDETGQWTEKPEPYVTIEVATAEEYEYIKKALQFYKKYNNKIKDDEQ